MKIYLMRHGETDYNKKGLIQGRIDIPLNEYGYELARRTKEGFEKQDISFDCAYVSPLTRARETADIILEGSNIPCKIDERVMEMSFAEGEGVPLERLNTDPTYENIRKLFQSPTEYIASPKGENYEDLFKRVNDFLTNELLPLEGTCDNVLVCCHGGIIRAFLCFMKKLPVEEFWNNHQPNCSVNIIQIKDQQISILEEHKVYYELPKEKKDSIL